MTMSAAHGKIRKLRGELATPVRYTLPIGEEVGPEVGFAVVGQLPLVSRRDWIRICRFPTSDSCLPVLPYSGP